MHNRLSTDYDKEHIMFTRKVTSTTTFPSFVITKINHRTYSQKTILFTQEHIQIHMFNV